VGGLGRGDGEGDGVGGLGRGDGEGDGVGGLGRGEGVGFFGTQAMIGELLSEQ
jgi:hypothetical protein